MRKLCLMLASILLPALPAPVAAQSSSPIHFAKGSNSATLNGTIIGRDYADYVLGAKAGQTMIVKLTVDATNGDGSAFFNILPPGSNDVAIFNGSMSADGNGQIVLPHSGNYTIRVYLMGNDKDAGKTVGYHVDVTIK
jgi:hypothetical protein